MSPDEPVPTRDELLRELARVAEERHELFARLVELESERTRQTMELFTMAAHELRTPLQSLVLATDLMLGRVAGSADELSREWLVGHLQRQHDTLTRMELLMTSWLNASAARAGTLPSQLVRGDLAEIVRQVVDRYESQLTWSGCQLDVSLQPVVGAWDRVRVDAVVGNLLSNAIKYGAGAAVSVAVASTDDGAVIIVRDRGIGIAVADHGRIFERFERANAPSRVPGFGVGLWMTRALLRSIGGAISVDSTLGEGSAFTVSLPRQPND